MRSAINNVEPEACAGRYKASAKGDDAPFDVAVLRLKEHLSGWGAPFADIEDETVREIATIIKGHWRRGTTR